MNITSILGKYLGHLAGYVLAGADIVSKVNPTLLPPQYGILLSVAGLVTVAAHHGFQAGTAQVVVKAATDALAQAPAKLVVAALMIACTLGLGSQLTACATAPTATEQSGIVVAVSVATGLAVSNGGKVSDLATQKARATEYKSIAVKVKAVNDAGTATLATLAAALQPEIVKLPPADQLAAQALVAALTPYLQSQIPGNADVKNVQTTVDLILAAVINACEAYGA